MPPPSEASDNEAAIRQAIEAREGVRTLAHMTVVDSMGDSMEREESAIETEERAIQKELYGERRPAADEDDSMKILAARDVTIYGQPESKPQPTPEAPANQPEAQKPASILPKLALTAALTALPALGAAAGVGIPWLMGMFDKEPAAEYVDSDTQYELRFGEPQTPPPE